MKPRVVSEMKGTRHGAWRHQPLKRAIALAVAHESDGEDVETSVPHLEFPGLDRSDSCRRQPKDGLGEQRSEPEHSPPGGQATCTALLGHTHG
jgi:hypothetical protein